MKSHHSRLTVEEILSTQKCYVWKGDLNHLMRSESTQKNVKETAFWAVLVMDFPHRGISFRFWYVPFPMHDTLKKVALELTYSKKLL